MGDKKEFSVRDIFRNKFNVAILVTFLLGLSTWIYNQIVLMPNYDSEFMFNLTVNSRRPLVAINHLVSVVFMIEVVIKLLNYSSSEGRFVIKLGCIVFGVVFIGAMLFQMILASLMFSGAFF